MTTDSVLSDTARGSLADDDSPFSPCESLYYHVDRALRRRAPVSIEHRDAGTLRIWPQEDAFESDAPSLARFCADQANSYRVHSLGHRSTPPACAARIEDLLWTIGFAASSGRLVEDLSGTEVIELSQWPNLTRVPLGHTGLRLAALYCRYPTSITVAARLTRAERAEVYQFLSAAWCAGLVRVVNQPCVTEERAGGERASGSLIKALLRRFWG